MRIVILDGYTVNPGNLSWDGLRPLGELEIYDSTPIDDEQTIINRIGNAEIVITNKTPIRAKVMEECPNIQFIAELGTGYDNIDITAARMHGILVSNIPGYGTATVAQFTIGLVLELCHKASERSVSVHNGRWTADSLSCYWDHTLFELNGKTLGIIGFGAIGQQTARVAKALGMNVITYSRTKKTQLSHLAEYVGFDVLLEKSDVISMHCPLTDETKNIIDDDALCKMKPGAFLINTSRGGLIDEDALSKALTCGKLAGAALDVVSKEPIDSSNPLLSAPNCIITPHIAWTSMEARQRVIDATISNVKQFLVGEPTYVVN